MLLLNEKCMASCVHEVCKHLKKQKKKQIPMKLSLVLREFSLGMFGELPVNSKERLPFTCEPLYEAESCS